MSSLLCDWNGTVVQDLQVTYSALMAVYAKAKCHPLSLEEFRVRFRLPLAEFLQSEGILASLSLQDCLHELSEQYLEHEDEVQPYPDAVEVLDRLRRRGIKLGLVTSSHRGIAERHLRMLGLGNTFDCIVASEDTTQQKPSPIPLLKCLSILKTDSCVGYLGDMREDVIASHGAGIPSIAISREPGSYHTYETLRQANPTAICHSLTDTVPLLLTCSIPAVVSCSQTLSLVKRR